MFSGRCYTCGGSLGFFGSNVTIDGRVVGYNCRRCAGEPFASPIDRELPAIMSLIGRDIIVCGRCDHKWRVQPHWLAQRYDRP